MSTTPAVSDYASALDFLLHRINYERTTNIPYRSSEFKLDRMRRLLALVGDPHLGLKAVHIAGTKGKGSTATMIAAVLQAAGYCTGLYTSPHLNRIEERIAIDGQICPQAEFVKLAAELQTAVEQVERELPVGESTTGPTFFEITTAMAFLHFARAAVDIAVLEVGLGGRLDSTNVCLPEVCLITSISFDHVKQLGNTLAAIAGEKAGIIKRGVPVVSGVMEPEPQTVIAERAAACGAPLLQRGVDFDFSQRRGAPANHSAGELLDYREPVDRPRYELTDVQLAMAGSHQAANAAAVIAAVNQLRVRGWSIGDDAIRQSLATARCPGRIEFLADSPAVILDVSHNPASVEALLKFFQDRIRARRRILIFASSKDKDYERMLQLLVPAFDVIVLTRYIENPRATEPEALLAIAQRIRSAAQATHQLLPTVLHATTRPVDAWRLCRTMAGPDDLIAIAGSFFLAAELRSLVKQGKVERVPA